MKYCISALVLVASMSAHGTTLTNESAASLSGEYSFPPGTYVVATHKTLAATLRMLVKPNHECESALRWIESQSVFLSDYNLSCETVK
jgi:hypothetical protein